MKSQRNLFENRPFERREFKCRRWKTPALDGKLADYARIGVPEVWLIDPTAETLEVLNLAAGHYARTALYGGDETLHSVALPGFALALATLFTPEDVVDLDGEPQRKDP